MKKLLLSIITASVLSACGSTYEWENVTHEQFKKTNAPSLSELQAMAERNVRDTLKDPEGAQVRFISKPTVNYRTIDGGPKTLVWGFCLEVNAKNGYGALTGFKKYFNTIDAQGRGSVYSPGTPDTHRCVVDSEGRQINKGTGEILNGGDFY